jgi:hypothetical protein
MAISLEKYYIKDDILIQKLINKVDEGIKKNNMNYKTNVYGEMTSYNYFLEDGKSLFNKIIEILPKLNYYDAWGNKYRKGDYALLHNHFTDKKGLNKFNGVSGVIYLNNVEPGTYFPMYDYEEKSEKGKIVLFNSILKHEVRPIQNDEIRYTMSFNALKE